MIGIVIIVQIKSCLTANQNVQHVSQILDCEPAYDLQHFKLNGHYQLNANIKVSLQSVSYSSSYAKHGSFYLWKQRVCSG